MKTSIYMAGRRQYSDQTNVLNNVDVAPCRTGARYCYQRVCLSVCLSQRMFQTLHVHTSSNSLHMLPVAGARSFSDNNAIRYVLPVLWMTSRIHIMGASRAESKATLCLVEFAKWRHRGEVCYLQLPRCVCTLILES